MSRRTEVFRRAVEGAASQRGAALMGICNVTPDSFSDGGRHFSLAAAKARVDELITEGADIIDVGGESTRPGASPVSAHDQIARVLEVVRYAAEARGACVSIDTSSPEVASACLDAGAAAVNDVSCLRDDRLAKVCASNGASLVLMHARGVQSQMRGFGGYPDDGYTDVVRDVLIEWRDAANRAMDLGLPRDALVMDPGFGFGKNARHSLELLRRIGEIVVAVEAPVMVGASRKSFLAVADRDASPVERIGASIAAALHAVRAGVKLVRVHDVRATKQAIQADRALSIPATKGG